jgi:hypothetical protein
MTKASIARVRRKQLDRLKVKTVRGVQVLDRRESPEGSCDLCPAVNTEIRPYGPKGEWVCFDCAMKDEATTAKKFNEVVFGNRLN